jgi:hypothetical protein
MVLINPNTLNLTTAMTLEAWGFQPLPKVAGARFQREPDAISTRYFADVGALRPRRRTFVRCLAPSIPINTWSHLPDVGWCHDAPLRQRTRATKARTGTLQAVTTAHWRQLRGRELRAASTRYDHNRALKDSSHDRYEYAGGPQGLRTHTLGSRRRRPRL